MRTPCSWSANYSWQSWTCPTTDTAGVDCFPWCGGRCLPGSGPVSIAAMADRVDLYLVLGFIDAIDDAVRPAACGVISVERVIQRFTCPVRVYSDRSLDRCGEPAPT